MKKKVGGSDKWRKEEQKRKVRVEQLDRRKDMVGRRLRIGGRKKERKNDGVI